MVTSLNFFFFNSCLYLLHPQCFLVFFFHDDLCHTEAINPLPALRAAAFKRHTKPVKFPTRYLWGGATALRINTGGGGASFWSRVYWVVNSSSHLMKAGQADRPCSREFMKQVFPKLTRPGTSPEKREGKKRKAHHTGPTLSLPLGSPGFCTGTWHQKSQSQEVLIHRHQGARHSVCTKAWS